MNTLSKKIDFALIIRVKNANPNGDPLNGNRPRTDYDGLGEISDVCLKRKIRDRLIERYMAFDKEGKEGQAVFVQSDDAKCDDATSLKDRLKKTLGLNELKKQKEDVELVCRTWIDVRAFGQLFAFKADKKSKSEESEGDTGTSVGIRGPVTIQSAFSIEPVSLSSIQIVKSVNSEDTKDNKKGSDTMGMKHRVDDAIYVSYGSMNPQLGNKTGFNDEDAQTIKMILPKIFENDASSARPEGSMEVLKVIWWEHSCQTGDLSSAKIHRSLQVDKDGFISFEKVGGPKPEVLEGF